MLPRLLLAILLGFPLLELLATLVLTHYIGWWILLWFALSALAGMLLLRGRRFFLVGNLMGALQRGGSPLQALFASGRLILAGILLIIPGVLSDVLALVILIWPARRAPPQPASDVIEGEFKREKS